MNPKIGVAFGSGGVQGLSHIGVVKVLDRHGIKADYVAGTSSGAAIAAAYAGGFSGEMMEQAVLRVNLLNFFKVRLDRMGFLHGDDYTDFIDELLENESIETAKIPLKLMAVNVTTGEKVVLTKGSIAKAVRASSSIPGVFIPVSMDDMLLVDGALLDPCPDGEVRRMGADIVIAISLMPGADRSEPKNIIEILMRSIDIISRHKEYADTDILIQPIVGALSPLKAGMIEECIRIGELAALAKIDEIYAQINSWKKNHA